MPWKHWLCSANTNNNTKTKQDGREQLRAGTLRSLVWLLILSSRTETMRRLGLNLCWVFQFSTPPTVALRDATLWSPDETVSVALSTDWLVMGKRGLLRRVRHCRVLILWELMFADSKHWQIQQTGRRGRIDMHFSGTAELQGVTGRITHERPWIVKYTLIFFLMIFFF